MNEFLLEENEIIKQENYIELSPVETLIPVGYFLIFFIIAGLVLHIFPARKDKSAILPLGLIGGTTILLFKVYILSSIDGFDLILKKTTIFPFNLLSILGIYFGISLGIIYSSKSRSWNFKKEEKPIFNIKNMFFKILILITLIFGLKIFFEGFFIKYNENNIEINKQKNNDLSSLNTLDKSKIYSEINESEIIKTYEILKKKNNELYDLPYEKNEIDESSSKKIKEDVINKSNSKDIKEDEINNSYPMINKKDKLTKAENNNFNYNPNKEYIYQPQSVNKDINRIQEKINRDYIPNRDYNYKPKVNQELNNLKPETQKLKNY